VEGFFKLRILVTGCAGFIGGHFVSYLDDSYSVIGIDDLSRQTSRVPIIFNNRSQHQFYKANIVDIDKLDLGDVDLVVHLAGQVSVVASVLDPLTDLDTNVRGSLAVARFAAQRKVPVIYSSTNKVFGDLSDTTDPIGDLHPYNPRTPYGVSKLAGGLYIADYVPNHYILHQSCIYGESQIGTLDQGWIGWLRSSISKGRDITCFGDGSQIRDLLHVDDLCRLYLMIIDGLIRPGSYVVGGGPTNAKTFLAAVEMLGGHVSKFEEWRPNDQRYFVSANNGLGAQGWSPEVSFDEWAEDNKIIKKPKD
jgi:CDP-paratose 2-epimerase